MAKDITREDMAEWVGYYFGLQRALNTNVVLPMPHAEGGNMAINKLRDSLQAEMEEVRALLPTDTIENWPTTVPSIRLV